MKKKRIIAVVALALVVVMLAVTLTACGPSSVDAAKKKMEKKGYNVVAVKNDDGTGAITVTKGIIPVLTAALYKSSSDAKEAYEKLDGKDYDNLQKIGKWVVFGTEQAIKDFK
ncbi:MAG TPA: hypothetical protein GXX64_04865 [Bacteroidales bacterium]|nr:hypothetical protein [Clostridiales bacterium]HHV03228.1 hypothetical protein [Bacteroidales bacterium]